MRPAEDGPAYHADGAAVDAAAFYRLACDPARSVVVEACAGAGKTWMLVSRILRALLEGVEPAQILAITFTRKAAGEMRERLDDWLAELADRRCSSDARIAALVQRGAPAAEAARLAPRLAGLREKLLRGERAVEVRTFHGWFAQLLAQAPQQWLAAAGLPTPWALIEDTSPLGPELFRRFQRAVDGDAGLALDYRELIVTHRRDTVGRWLQSAWHYRVEIERADAAGTLADAVASTQVHFADERERGDDGNLCARVLQPPLRDGLLALAQDLSRGGARAQEAAAKILTALGEAEPEIAYDGVVDALFTQAAGERRKTLGKSARLVPMWEAIELLRDKVEQRQAHLDHGRLVRLSRRLLAEYRGLKRERGLVDMADLETAALAMLSDGVTSGWLQERLDLRLRQVLIDEFQDTSPLQWQALFGWLSAYAGAGGGASGQRAPSLFIVGDPKQSIYRFRRAEPRVFAAAREFVVDGLGGHALACDHTRRNAPEVVDAVNRVFADAAATDGWVPFRPHTTGSDAGGQVRALPEVPRSLIVKPDTDTTVWRDSLTTPRREAEQRLRRVEAGHVVAAVQRLLSGGEVSAGGVMVLSRTRFRLAEVAVALAARQIAFVMPEALPLAESPEALDLVAVLDVLASPSHDLALARALKSPLFTAADDDLLWLAGEARAQRRSWLRTLLDGAPPERPALQQAAALLRGWSDAAAWLSPHELLDRIVFESDFEARLVAAVPTARRHVARQALHGLLTAALEFEDGRYVSVYRFVRALKQGHLRAAAKVPQDAVQLYTVHGAKGLEADAVFVVDCEPEFRAAERGTLLVDWPVDRVAPRSVAFVRTLSRVAPSLAAIHAEEVRARDREETNILYVAMTRARRWLAFSRTEPYIPTKTARSWWERVEPASQPWDPGAEAMAADAAAAASLGAALAAVAAVAAGPAEVEQLPEAPGRSAEAPPVPSAAEARAAGLGKAVHRLLEWIGQPHQPLAREQWPQAAADAAAAFALDPGTAREVLVVATAVLDSPQCAPFFDPSRLRFAGNEVPVAFEGQALRIDRLVQLSAPDGSAEWWVLDYKLRQRPEALEAYREQLERYRLAVRALMPGETVRAAFIGGRGALVEI